METSLDESGTHGPHRVMMAGLDRAQRQIEALGNL
jgi:hypothetical protein